MEIIHPDIWKMIDDRIENAFPYIPIELNFTLLSCIEEGRIDLLKECMNQRLKDYLYACLPTQEKWVQVMCFNSGSIFAFAIKGGLSCERASSLTTKYIQLASTITEAKSFIELVMQLYIDMAQEVQLARKNRTSHAIVNEAIAYIEDHIDEKISVEAIAKACFYSVSGIQHLFSKYMKISLGDFIRQKKIEKACFLLAYTHLDGARIAEKLSYSSQSYFISQFQKEVGITPARYRRIHLKTMQ